MREGVAFPFMNILFVVVAVIVSVVVCRFLYRVMFDDSDDFWSCVGFSFTPDLLSLFRGEYWEDRLKSLKFGAFVAAVIGSGVFTWWGLGQMIG